MAQARAAAGTAPRPGARRAPGGAGPAGLLPRCSSPLGRQSRWQTQHLPWSSGGGAPPHPVGPLLLLAELLPAVGSRFFERLLLVAGHRAGQPHLRLAEQLLGLVLAAGQVGGRAGALRWGRQGLSGSKVRARPPPHTSMWRPFWPFLALERCCPRPMAPWPAVGGNPAQPQGNTGRPPTACLAAALMRRRQLLVDRVRPATAPRMHFIVRRSLTSY